MDFFDTTSNKIEKKLEVSEKLPRGFLNLTKPEHSCILHGVLAFLFELFWHHLHLSWKKKLEVASKKFGGGVKSLSNHESSVFLWRWCQIFVKQIKKVGGGGIIFSEAEA